MKYIITLVLFTFFMGNLYSQSDAVKQLLVQATDANTKGIVNVNKFEALNSDSQSDAVRQLLVQATDANTKEIAHVNKFEINKNIKSSFVKDGSNKLLKIFGINISNDMPIGIKINKLKQKKDKK